MSILTQAIDESRRRRAEQSGTAPGISLPDPVSKGSTPLTRAIDQARQRQSQGQSTGQVPSTVPSGVTLPVPAKGGLELISRGSFAPLGSRSAQPNDTPGSRFPASTRGGLEWMPKGSFTPLGSPLDCRDSRSAQPNDVPRDGQGHHSPYGRTTGPAAWRPPRSTQMVREEMDALDRTLQPLRQQYRQLDQQATTMMIQATHATDPNMQAIHRAHVQETRDQVKELAEEIARLEQDRAGLQAEWDRADEREFEWKRQTPEFQETVKNTLGQQSGAPDPMIMSPYYRDVVKAMNYFRAKEQGDEWGAGLALVGANMAVDKMSEGQRDRLVWYVSQGDYAGAADYLRRVMPALSRETGDQVEQGTANWAQEHPVLGAAANAVSWPLNIPAYFDHAGQAVENLLTGEDRQSPYLSAYAGPKIGSGTAQGTQEAARSAAVQATGSEFAGDAASFLTGTGLSIGQNVTQAAALGPLSLPAMALSAAGSSTVDALDRGGTPGQAVALGTAAGAIEALTEKIPLENLFRLAKEGGGQGLKAALKETLKQMGTEALEEGISEVLGNLADAAIMGDRSEFQLYVRELQNTGLSEQEAWDQAFLQFYLFNTLASAAGGGISGGVMGGGALAAYELSPEGKAARTNSAIDQAYAAIQENGLFSPEAEQAAKKAAERLDKTRKGPWDGIYLPRGDEGTITAPRAGDAAQTAQEAIQAAQGAVQGDQGAEGQDRHSAAPNDRSDSPSDRLEAVIRPSGEQPARQSATAPVQAAQGAVPGTQTAAQTRTEEIRDVVRQWGEDLAQGRVTEEEYDRALDLIEEQAGLEGLDISDILMGPGEGGIYDGQDGSGRTAAPDEQQLFSGNGGRVSGASAGGKNGGVAEGGPRGSSDTSRAAIERQNTGRTLGLQQVSSRELGMLSGTDTKTAAVLPESAWDGVLRDTAWKVRRETGLPVRFVLGSIEITGSDGTVRRVRGVYHEDGILVQADHMRVSPEQIADHEMFHHFAQQDPGLIQAIKDAIVDRVGQENLDRVVDTYIKKLRGLTDFQETGFEADFEQAYQDILNEVFADAFAGINAFGTDAGQYQGTVLDTLEDRGTAGQTQSRETAQATDQRRGPHRSPAKRVRWGEETQGSGWSFRRRRKRRQADFGPTTGRLRRTPSTMTRTTGPL